MSEVGIRELKQHTSKVLRRVRERKETITITYRGRAIARLVPVRAVRSERTRATAVWADMDELASEIGAHWPADISAIEAVGEQRREL